MGRLDVPRQVVAPLFYLFLGGVPLAIAYKAVSTLDSMIGYRTERYLYFGKFAARLDDVMNFIPVRLTALFIVIAATVLRSHPLRALSIAWRDHANHLSPNEGGACLMPGHSDALARDFRVGVNGPQLETPLDRQHGGNVDAWARSVGVEAGEILDFSASINPVGPPPSTRKVFIASYGAISRYPDPYGAKLKKALADRHGLSTTEVLLGNGSTQLIYLVCAALRPRNALIVGPAFSEYENALMLCGATIRQFSLGLDDGLGLSLSRFMAAWDRDFDIVFLSTPNSFTGQLISKRQIEEIAGIASALGAEYFRVAMKRRTDHLRLLAALGEWTESSIG